LDSLFLAGLICSWRDVSLTLTMTKLICHPRSVATEGSGQNDVWKNSLSQWTLFIFKPVQGRDSFLPVWWWRVWKRALEKIDDGIFLFCFGAYGNMFDKIPVGQDSFLPVCFGAYRNAPELTLTMMEYF